MPRSSPSWTQRLPAALACDAAAYLTAAAPGPPTTAAGDTYTTTTVDLVVEVLEGTTRHQVVTATRVR
ncbi:hypothetical protein AB0424_28715 [Streptomyces sp. NPDC051180]|uniref:hypothetical protein n=1 Tax=unclassified Streptomyces TaxID=2593676 RepID=UPI00344F7CFA